MAKPIVSVIGCNFGSLIQCLEKNNRLIVVGSLRKGQEILNWTNEIFDRLVLERAKTIKAVIGHGTGGMAAMKLVLAIRGRDDFLIEKLVLISTSCTPVQQPSLNSVQLLIDNWIDSEISAHCEIMDKSIIENWIFEANMFDISDQMHLIQLPTLIAHGTDDAIISFRHAFELNEYLLGSKLVRVMNVGHLYVILSIDSNRLFMADNVESVVKDIEGFIS